MTVRASNAVQSATWIVIFGMLGKLVGFVREMVIAREFGVSAITDAFRASQTIPTVLFAALATALATTVVPISTEIRTAQGEEGVARFANNLLGALIALASILIVVGLIITPLLVRLIVPGFTDARYGLTIEFTRLTMPSFLFVMITALFSGLLNARRRFIAPAAAPIPLSVAMIAGVLLFAGWFGGYALAYAYLAGAFIQAAFLLPSLFRIGFVPRPRIDLADPWVRRVAVLTLPVLAGSVIRQINMVFTRVFGSLLPTGSVSVLDYANRIDGLVLGVVIAAAMTVSYTRFSEVAATKDRRAFRSTFSKAITGTYFLVLPMVAGLMVLSAPIVRFIYERGAFTVADTARTAAALFYLAPALLGYGARDIATRAFFSLQDTKTPMTNSIFTASINLASLAIFILTLGMGVRGMAIATSLTAILGTAILVWRLRRKLGGLDGRRILASTARMGLAALGMAAAVWFIHPAIVKILPGLSMLRQGLQLGMTIAAGGALYALLCWCLGVEEVSIVAAMLGRLISRFVPFSDRF